MAFTISALYLSSLSTKRRSSAGNVEYSAPGSAGSMSAKLSGKATSLARNSLAVVMRCWPSITSRAVLVASRRTSRMDDARDVVAAKQAVQKRLFLLFGPDTLALIGWTDDELFPIILEVPDRERILNNLVLRFGIEHILFYVVFTAIPQYLRKSWNILLALPHGRDEKLQQEHSSRRKTELAAADLQLHS